jgi:tRNA (guanine-N7-)-methyltransferase
MGKDKLKRFKENETFTTLIQPKIIFPPVDHELKGNWKKDYFKNDNPLILELGCGRGEYAVNLAIRFPGKNFIGVDWKGARLWRGAKTAFEDKMPNVAFLRIQIQNICAFFGKEEVDEIWITFPDPKLLKTGENKRLTSSRFLNLYRQFMITKGIVNLKTDSKPLFDFTNEVIANEKLEIKISTDDVYELYKDDEILNIKTTYEKLWLKQGAKICYLRFKINPPNEGKKES